MRRFGRPWPSRSLTAPARWRARRRRGRACWPTLGLQVPGPLAILVSRLTEQKGIDLLPQVLPAFLEAGGGLAVLGSGDPGLESALRSLSARYPTQVSVRIGYDEA